MGCDAYYLAGNGMPIMFGELDDSVGCLCTFPHHYNETLDADALRSLAMLGATVVLLRNGNIDNGYIPGCLPKWFMDELNRLLPVES